MTVAPSSYFPAVFNLSDGPVQKVETSETNPKAVFDSGGLHMYGSGATPPVVTFDSSGITGKADPVGGTTDQGIIAQNSDGSQSAGIDVTVNPNASAGSRRGVKASVSGFLQKWLLNDLGQSDYVLKTRTGITRLGDLYSTAFNIPFGGDGSNGVDLNVDDWNPDFLIGSCFASAGFQYPQAINWAWQLNSAGHVTIFLTNRTSGSSLSAIGTFKFIPVKVS